METRWLSYDEIAAALRITPASARRLVARNKQWPRKAGNDGRARIGQETPERLRDRVGLVTARTRSFRAR